jgi:Tfp pilus assembly protein PilO
MKTTDRTILVAVMVLGLLAAFWFLVLTPKRDQVAELDSQISTAEADLDQQRQLVAAGEAAKDGYPSDYQRLVVLGKAVPADDDAGSLFVEFNEIANDAGVRFSAITAGAGESAPPPPATLTEADPAAGSEGDAGSEEGAAPEATPAVATEAVAASLPLGATVGSAGLPVIPYDLELDGGFFGFADFFHGVDELVSTGESGVAQSGVSVDGRLVTIDGFQIAVDEAGGLSATVNTTTYVTPADQGITGGATPTAPAATPVAAPASAPPAVAPTAAATTP